MPNLPPLPITGTLAERLCLVRNGIPYEVVHAMEVDQVAEHVLALADLDDVLWDDRSSEPAWIGRNSFTSREEALLHNEYMQVYKTGAPYGRRIKELRNARASNIMRMFIGQIICSELLDHVADRLLAETGERPVMTAHAETIQAKYRDGTLIEAGPIPLVQPTTAST